MNAQQFAALALEWWRASGPRTHARLDASIINVLTTYYGATPWPQAVSDLAQETTRTAYARIHAWEVA